MSTALQWFKSTYGGSEGGECLEGAYAWPTSSYSSSEGGQCLEVATCPHTIHVRDSKNPAGPTFTVSPEAWAAFADYAAR
ncbi:DUF397 domain-containing protein [Streptomyces sp. NPDC052036]|uniref:DUF397 domain-containing protein n=1 Tax=unclassified Streptomyces TaxID=2593676 RepID=UPI0034295FA9